MIIKAMMQIEAASARAEEAGRAAELAAVAALAAADSWMAAARALIDDPVLRAYHQAEAWWTGRAQERDIDDEGREIARVCQARGRDAVLAYLEGRLSGDGGAVDIAEQVATAEVAIIDGPPGPWHRLWAELRRKEVES